MVDLSCFDWIQLIKKSSLPPNAKYLGLYLGTFMNHDNDIAWPSMKRISHETGLSIPTARKWLDYLDAEGWLVKRRNVREVFTLSGGTQMQNEYITNIPEEVIRGVNDLLPHLQGGKTVDVRGVNESRQGGKQLSPNNNRITSNNKRKSAPSLQEIKDYVISRGSNVDPVKFYEYFTEGDWKDSKGNKVKNWKQKLITWEGFKKETPVYGRDGI